jgi:uncharacterized membrane protein YidH (DUF202 family)
VAPPLRELEQTAAGRLVVFVRLEVFGKLLDAASRSPPHFRRSGIAVVAVIFAITTVF